MYMKVKMKKLLLALSMIALPLTAMAADKPDRMSDATIDAAVKQFGPSFCAKTVDGIKEAAEKVYDCYQKTPKDSSDYEVCFLGDNAVNTITSRIRDKTNALGKENPFQNIVFFSEDNFAKRFKDMWSFPKYKNYSQQELSNYHQTSGKIFGNRLYASCKTLH